MYILLRDYNEIVRVSKEKYTDEYIRELLQVQTDSDRFCPYNKNTSDVTYNTKVEGSVYTLIKSELYYSKGYMYSALKSRNVVLTTISILEYSEVKSNKSIFESKLTEKLNTRILSNMDKDSLLQFILDFNSGEDAYKISAMLANHKKTLYSSIAHKLKRFGSS